MLFWILVAAAAALILVVRALLFVIHAKHRKAGFNVYKEVSNTINNNGRQFIFFKAAFITQASFLKSYGLTLTLVFFTRNKVDACLTVIPRPRIGSESIAHEAEGRMGYPLRGHEGERNNCFRKIQLVGQKYRDKATLASKTPFKRHLSSPHIQNIVVYNVKEAYALAKRDILKINNLQTDLEAHSVS